MNSAEPNATQTRCRSASPSPEADLHYRVETYETLHMLELIEGLHDASLAHGRLTPLHQLICMRTVIYRQE